MLHTQAFHSQTLDHVIVDGILRVLVDAESGEPIAVQDAATGCAAEFLYSQRAIRAARDAARRAWASTADLF